MATFDDFGQGLNNIYGTYDQLYSATPRLVGNTVVTRPRSYNLSNLYSPESAGASVAAPALPPLADPGDIYGDIRGDQPLLPTTGAAANIDELLEASPDWVQQNINGTWRWFPSNAQEGQSFQDNDQNYYIYRGGRWISNVPVGGQYVPDEGWRGLWQHYRESNLGQEYEPADQAKNLSFQEWVQWYHDYWSGRSGGQANEIRDSLADELRLMGIDPGTGGQVQTVDSYMDQWNTLMTNLESGDWSIDDIPEDNPFFNWFQGVVDDSWNTGLITGEGFTGQQAVDENGELVFDDSGNPIYELSESMQALVDNLDEQDAEGFNQYMKGINRVAAQKGHTTASGAYSSAVSQHLAQRTLQIEETIRARIGEEVQQQYTYVANSIGNMLRSIGKEEQARLVEERMFQAYEDIYAQYSEGLNALAHDAAMTESARSGQIITAILGFISRAIGISF